MRRQGVMLIHDYSQIELRFGAWLCQDPIFIKALTHDIHWINLGIIEKICGHEEIATMTRQRQGEIVQAIHSKYLREASEESLPGDFYNAPYDEVREALAEAGAELATILFKWENMLEVKRTVAKKNSFGPYYGMTPRSFALQNNISESKAEEMFALDKELYKIKHEWIAETMAEARGNCFVKSVFGKRRHLDYKAHNADVLTLDRQAVNTMIQGPASDLTFLAGIETNRLMKESDFPCLHIAAIHDSIMQDARPDVYVDAIKISQEVMQTTPIKVLGDRGVPFEADSKYSFTSWAEMKKWKGEN